MGVGFGNIKLASDLNKSVFLCSCGDGNLIESGNGNRGSRNIVTDHFPRSLARK